MSTQQQMIGNSLLQELKFEFIPTQDADGNMICGGPQTYKATAETVVLIQSLLDEGTRLILVDDGSVRFESDLDDEPPSQPR